MNEEASIDRLLQRLQEHGVRSTKEVRKDFIKLVNTDLEGFVEAVFSDFTMKDFEKYNRFEKLRNLTRAQRRRLKGNILRRYEYRNTSNLKCIFIIYKEKNSSTPILLCAFNEDGDKKTGKQSYNKNIDIAIDIFERVIG